MSGLQDFLAPFSHLVFANRNIVIVLVCAVAFWAAMQALKDRWRADKLQRDLNAAQSSASTAPAGRRYANVAAEEPVAESGGALPPIKAGRTYARNLGTALQKAGMSSPQIYSPPTPSGFTPNTNQPQPAMGQPGGTPFGAPATPWGAPAPAPTPWAFPAGTGRNTVPPPAPAPFYQPQPPAPTAPQPGPFAGQGPVFGAPSFTPPQQPAPYPAPAPTTAQGPAAPSFAPPPSGPMMPATPPVPPMAPASGEPESDDAARRGKPKRRRFNFNVLENLEKMVQSKPADSTAAAGPVPPAPPATPAATPAQASAAPAIQPATPATPPAAPALPFLFGQRDEPKAAASPAPATVPEKAAEAAAEPDIAEQALPFDATEEPAQPATAGVPVAPEPKPEARRSMRSMMFGEEIAAAGGAGVNDQESAAEAEPEAVPAAEGNVVEAQTEETTEPAEAGAAETESTWSQPWRQREEAAADDKDRATSDQEPSSSTGADAELPLRPFGSYDPWKPVEPESVDSAPAATESEPWTAETPSESAPTEPEPAAVSADAEAPAAEAESVPSESASVTENEAVAEPVEQTIDGTPEVPTGAESDRPSAGTLVIIEDDQTAASYYATLFGGNGYRVEVANDGVSGVDLATRVQPQVILLDVMMPRQNGILVLQTLRASDETKNTPVVVMSNFSEPTLIKRALQLGALEYVIKTQVEGPALLNALPRWMNREKAFAAA